VDRPGTACAPRMGRLAPVALLIALALLLVAPRPRSATPTGQGAAAVTAAWVELGPGGDAVVRAVSGRADCPPLLVGGAPRPMTLRAAAAPPDFALPVCEALLPPGATAASVGDQPLPVPRPEPRRIVVIGDAGCRIEEGDPIQDCDDLHAWPFARVATHAAAWGPDLVIHVGDYVYRESACPPKLAVCAVSPWGDNWAAWQADLFAPATPLLRAAPWVFTRGNHEVCSRGGAGWFRLLDPRPYVAACERYTEPYAVDLGDLQLVVLDSAQADDFVAQPDEVDHYRAQFARVAELAGPNTWLVHHRPLWAVGQSPREAGPAGLFRTNPTLQAASDNRLPAGVQLVLSGHLHIWEALAFADERPPQMVVGNAGTNLDPPVSTALAGLDVGGTRIASGSTRHDWGFTTLERADAGWLATLRDVDGAPLLTCHFADRQFTCPLP
jgi:Calcineurin-like phosphoesterase